MNNNGSPEVLVYAMDNWKLRLKVTDHGGILKNGSKMWYQLSLKDGVWSKPAQIDLSEDEPSVQISLLDLPNSADALHGLESAFGLRRSVLQLRFCESTDLNTNAWSNPLDFEVK